MKYLISIMCCVLFCSCVSKNYSSNPRKLKVRLTTYSKTEKRCDKWTRRGKSSTGIKLFEGAAAVDPKVIPYFSDIFIPEIKLKLEAIDTGGAVKSRLASRKTGRNEPIIDIFFHKESEARKFRLENPQIVEVLIFN